MIINPEDRGKSHKHVVCNGGLHGEMVLSLLWALAMLCSVFFYPKGIKGQDLEGGKRDRQPAVAGTFYPAADQQLKAMLGLFFPAEGINGQDDPMVLVVPHAGYVFSGEVAAAAYKLLPREKSYRHIFIIGPAHRTPNQGAAIYTSGDFITPLGRVPTDPLGAELAAKSRRVSTDPSLHRQEHCIEVQLPFLQYWLKKPFSIIPILVGSQSEAFATELANLLAPYYSEENLFIISADFSHYPGYDTGRKADHLTAGAIAANDSREFMRVKEENETAYAPELVTAICGWMPMLTALKITERDDRLAFRKVMYRNSGDSPHGDKDKVVGYWALAASRETESTAPTGQEALFSLQENDQATLLELARSTISARLRGRPLPEIAPRKLTPALTAKGGAFVTLRKNGELRGCIGNFSSAQPLWLTVREMAIAAACHDSRFSPVTMTELPRLQIEISLLTPLKRISSAREFRLGRDGIYIRKGSRSGTYLPQVAEETGWTTSEFLEHCCRDKAGLPPDAWKEKDTELYTYQTLVFSEEKPAGNTRFEKP